MTRLSASICALALSVAATLSAQSSSSSQAFIDSAAAEGGGAIHSMKSMPPRSSVTKPFSRVALSGGISALGANVSMATNLNRYMNLRGSGNLLNYTVNNISTNGFNIGAKLNMASAGTSVDFYPFPKHGFRISPGALFYNQNSVTGSSTVAAGQSFTLNNATYYSSASSPVTGTGSLALNTNKRAFTATTGWGNMIPRNGGHWSFPFEIGAAFIGTPKLNMSIAGIACDSTGAYCQNVATNSQIQSNLQAQVAKYQKDLDPLKTYPIVSFGLAYSFKTRSGR